MSKPKLKNQESILSPEKINKTLKEILAMIILSPISIVIIEQNGQKLVVKKPSSEIFKSEIIGWIKLCPKLEEAKEKDTIIEKGEELFEVMHLNLCELVFAKIKMKIVKVYINDGDVVDWGKKVFSYLPLE